jgi:hypothetical protein
MTNEEFLQLINSYSKIAFQSLDSVLVEKAAIIGTAVYKNEYYSFRLINKKLTTRKVTRPGVNINTLDPKGTIGAKNNEKGNG